MALGGGCGAGGEEPGAGRETSFSGPPLLPCSLLESSLGAHGGKALDLGGAAEAKISEMESLCGADLPALAFLADKAPHLSP